VATVLVLSLAIAVKTAGPTTYRVVPAANEQVVLGQVAAATKITTVPKDLQPSLSSAFDWGGLDESVQCQATYAQTSEGICPLGDLKSDRLMVVYGDSHALMWLPAFEAIARSARLRLVVLGRSYCPAEMVTIANQWTWKDPGGPYLVCDQWHRWAVNWINRHKPRLLVITQENGYFAPSVDGSLPISFSDAQWRAGLVALFNSIHVPNMTEILLGNTPTLIKGGPACLGSHPKDIQFCSEPARSAVQPLNPVERSTARAAGVGYVDPIPWFCSRVCTVIIDHYRVYLDTIHMTATWARYLENVLALSLGLPLVD
jgi:hypothetical protein